MLHEEYAGATVVGRAISTMGLACALAGIVLGGVSIEIPGIAPGAAGYGLAARASIGEAYLAGVISEGDRDLAPSPGWDTA
jgi:hypothetical protein